MTYVEGFVLAVPAANKEAYVRHAAEAEPLFKEFGVKRLVEAWGDDIPDGKVTDFKGAVKAQDDEVVVFGWLEYPSRQARDVANEKMRSDPRMQALGDLPFDGKRMIFGGFESIVDEGNGKRGGYVDGYLVPVPEGNKDAYRKVAELAAQVFKEYGATRIVECWGDDLPDGKVTDFKGAVKAAPGENVVFAWIVWPSKAVRDAANKKIMEDPRMQPGDDMPFDGKRLIYGGFEILLEAE